MENPITEIARLSASIHTTRKILLARLEKIGESLPSIPPGFRTSVLIVEDCEGDIHLIVDGGGMSIRRIGNYGGEEEIDWSRAQSKWIPRAAKAVGPLLESLRLKLEAGEKEETALAGSI